MIEGHLDGVVKHATRAIQNADSYEEMLWIAQRVERYILGVLRVLERVLGPGKVKTFDITVCNEEVGRCVTFDPIHLCGFR